MPRARAPIGGAASTRARARRRRAERALTRGPRAPKLDLNAPPHCCPFNVYTEHDHERERLKEMRRCEARTAAAAADAWKARRAAKIEEVVQKAMSADANSLSSSSAAMETNEPTNGEQSAQVRVVRLMPAIFVLKHLPWLQRVYRTSFFFLRALHKFQEQIDLTAVFEREMAIKRAVMSRPGHCELCEESFNNLGEVRTVLACQWFESISET